MIIFLLSMYSTMAQTQEDSELVLDDGYRIEVIARQFAFDLIDLNLVDNLIADGMDNNTARSMAILTNRVVDLVPSSDIEIIAYSIDVLHGLTIPKLDLNLELQPPLNGTIQVHTITTHLPDISTNTGAYCSIFCGQNHEDMQFIMVIGDGGVSGFRFLGLDPYRWLFIFLILMVSVFIVYLGIAKPFWNED